MLGDKLLFMTFIWYFLWHFEWLSPIEVCEIKNRKNISKPICQFVNSQFKNKQSLQIWSDLLLWFYLCSPTPTKKNVNCTVHSETKVALIMEKSPTYLSVVMGTCHILRTIIHTAFIHPLISHLNAPSKCSSLPTRQTLQSAIQRLLS